MPVMDGWEFLDAYEQLPGEHAAVIICSSRADPLSRATWGRVARTVLWHPTRRRMKASVGPAHAPGA
jgi:CheY-like chemotaxis protein